MTKDLPANRRERVLAMVRENGFARVTEVAQALNVAPITVRRDIAELAKKGVVEQIRGGARVVPGSPTAASRPLPDTVIGVVTPSLDYYWPAIIQGASEEADLLGVRLVVQVSTYAATDNLKQFRALAEHGSVSGLVLVPELADESSSDLLDFLEDLELPTVLMERALRPHGSFTRTFESVSTDHRNGANMAVRCLASLGHQRLGLLSDRKSPTQVYINHGWSEAVDELGLTTISQLTDGSGHRADASGAAVIEAFIDRCLKNSVTAVLAHPDETALAFVEHLLRRGIEVPRDMSVITYDDELASLSRPALTAVAPPKHALGTTAMRMVVDRILSPGNPIMRVELQPSLMIRDSTAPPPH